MISHDYELLPEEWNVPVLSCFQLATPGVLLEVEQETAVKHAVQLKGSQSSVGLVTVRPLEEAVQTKRVTFKLKETGSVPENIKIVTGFVNSFGPTPIQHLTQVDVVTRELAMEATQVIMALSRRDAVSNSEMADPHSI